MFKVYAGKRRFGIIVLVLVLLLRAGYGDSLAHGDSERTYLFLTSLGYIAHENGEFFEAVVNVSLVQNLHRLEFTLTYNASLLSVENVSEGPFFPAPPRSVFAFQNDVQLGQLEVNVSLADPDMVVDGNGTVAVVGFRVAQGLGPRVNCPLCLREVSLFDASPMPIPYDSLDALFFWKSTQPDPPTEGRMLDVYTLKGGTGSDAPDGMYALGDTVTLISRLTYNDSPVQQKLVGFEVRDPQNESIVFRTAITDANGLAAVSFRIPLVVGMNGTWNAISVADVAEKAVWDTMVFWVNFTLPPVGGYSLRVKEHTTENPLVECLLLTVLTAVIVIVKPRMRRRDRKIFNVMWTKSG